MRDETWHDDGFSVVKGTCWRGRSWKSGLEKWQGGPAALPWKKMGHSGASSGRPTLRACPRLACVGEQREPRAGTESLMGPSSAQLSRHSRLLPIGYFCYGMCQPLGFSWGTGAQVTPSPHSAPPSVSGCVWGWAGKLPMCVQSPPAGTDKDIHVSPSHCTSCVCVCRCNLCVWGSG